MAMKPLKTDFSALEAVGFDKPPVGVKFEYFKPQGIQRLDHPLALCEFPREAQRTGKVFYMDRDNENCMGKGCLGMMDGDPTWAGAGLIGERMDIFSDGVANRKCMTHYTVLNPGGTNYVVFAPLPALQFEPDLLVCTGDVRTIGTLLRAMAYSTGELMESKLTPVFQCSWMFSYPVMTGKVNYVIMGIGHGTTARETYEPGELCISIPAPWFDTIMRNLQEMPLVPEAWAMGRDKWLVEEEKVYGKIISDAQEAGWA